MQPLKALSKVVDDLVHVGGKKSNYQEEIYGKRTCQRKLTQEFGMNVFYAYQKGKRDQVDALYDELALRYEELNKEIHRLESRFGATHKIPLGVTTFRPFLISEEKGILDRKIPCEKCKEIIPSDEKCIEIRLDEEEANKIYYHQKCFTCGICASHFATQQLGLEVYFLEGKPFCTTSSTSSSCISKAESRLLAWVQTSLSDFVRIDVKNFDTSFNDGLVFAGLIRHWKPEYLDINELYFDNPVKTLATAFKGMEWSGIPVLLHSKFMHETDRISIVTQVGIIKYKFETLTPHPEGVKVWNKNLTPKIADQFCKADEYLKGKDHVIGPDSSSMETKKEKEDIMIFDNNPSLVTGSSSGGKKAYELSNPTTGERTIREPVSSHKDG